MITLSSFFVRAFLFGSAFLLVSAPLAHSAKKEMPATLPQALQVLKNPIATIPTATLKKLQKPELYSKLSLEDVRYLRQMLFVHYEENQARLERAQGDRKPIAERQALLDHTRELLAVENLVIARQKKLAPDQDPMKIPKVAAAKKGGFRHKPWQFNWLKRSPASGSGSKSRLVRIHPKSSEVMRVTPSGVPLKPFFGSEAAN
jgi:hypothetical protein